jgi:exopolyphosphatase / guanosine-5'-triphosphate,3'-diphosphate pyrophosphatase
VKGPNKPRQSSSIEPHAVDPHAAGSNATAGSNGARPKAPHSNNLSEASIDGEIKPIGFVSQFVSGASDHANRDNSTNRAGRWDSDRLDQSAFAALDLGTNNCRLLVARPTRRGFKVIDAFSRIIRLGEGVTASGRLSEPAMARTIQALEVCAAKISRHHTTAKRLVATEACRLAVNAGEFLDRVYDRLGLDIEILSREEEARLAVSGCASLIEPGSDLVLVFDIGGGSSELIWLDLKGRQTEPGRSLYHRADVQNAIHTWTSLPVGVVTLTEAFGGRFVDAGIFENMVDQVTDLLAPFEARSQIRPLLNSRDVHLLGTSGTVTTVAGVHLGLPRYDRSRVDGCWLLANDVRQVTSRLLAGSIEDRIAEPCIGRERADLVLAGCAILEALMRMWPCERLRVADRGLREGILTMLMTDDRR